MDEINLDIVTRRDDTFWIYKVQGATHRFSFVEDRSVSYAGNLHRWALHRWLDSPIGPGKVENSSWGSIKALYR